MLSFHFKLFTAKQTILFRASATNRLLLYMQHRHCALYSIFAWHTQSPLFVIGLMFVLFSSAYFFFAVSIWWSCATLTSWSHHTFSFRLIFRPLVLPCAFALTRNMINATTKILPCKRTKVIKIVRAHITTGYCYQWEWKQSETDDTISL